LSALFLPYCRHTLSNILLLKKFLNIKVGQRYEE
jgi:hypothetical protein